MIREVPLRYAATFYVEADSREALEAAVAYVAKHMSSGWVVYACGPSVCTCKTEIEWDGERLTVRSCLKRALNIAAKLLIKVYTWYGGKAIQLVRCEAYKP